jgi:hypothetical protein
MTLEGYQSIKAEAAVVTQLLLEAKLLK